MNNNHREVIKDAVNDYYRSLKYWGLYQYAIEHSSKYKEKAN